MVSLYVAGQKVGTLAGAERLLPGFIARKETVELRDDAGRTIAHIVSTEVADANPVLVDAITSEEYRRPPG